MLSCPSFNICSIPTQTALKVALLLHQSPRGLSSKEIARLCKVNVRTTYRDLDALQIELEIPIWEDNRRYGLVPGYFLPPLKLTLMEAMALFLSARLASRYADERDPFIEAAFIKLGAVLPPAISEHVHDTVRAMSERREDASYVRYLEILTKAWANRCRVRIWYPRSKDDGSDRKGKERLLDPYFIEPSGIGHSCYVIGYDHFSQAMRTFKVERILNMESTNEEYAIPQDWSVVEYLRASWGIVHDDEVEVCIRFSQAAVSRIKEATWHPSQQLIDEPGGSLLYTVRVAGTMEITPWILSWGAEAEVLAPAELRTTFARISHRQAAVYSSSNAP